MKRYNNKELILKLSKLFSELDKEDKVKFISDYILTHANEDMMNFVNNSINRHNIPKYVNQEEIQKFLDEE